MHPLPAAVLSALGWHSEHQRVPHNARLQASASSIAGVEFCKLPDIFVNNFRLKLGPNGHF